MSEFTPLREAVDTLASSSASPDFGDLKRRAARRRRRRVALVAAAATAAVIAGSALAVTGTDDRQAVPPIGQPTTPSPESPTGQASPEPSPGSDEYYEVELRKILAQVPDWAVTGGDPTIIAPCGGDWSSAATGAGGGSFAVSPPRGDASVYSTGLGFPSAAEARDAVTFLAENLESCTAVAWRTQTIAQTRALLASSPGGVIWIQQKGSGVSTLEVPTNDGPPPEGVQVGVADWMVAGMTHSRID